MCRSRRWPSFGTHRVRAVRLYEETVRPRRSTHACSRMLPAGNISSAYRKPHTCWQHHAALNGGMAYSEPARTAARRTRSTVYRPGRRRVLLGAIPALLLAHTAFAAGGHLLNDTGRMLNDKGRTTYVSPVSWPQRGQAAFVLGNSRPAA